VCVIGGLIFGWFFGVTLVGSDTAMLISIIGGGLGLLVGLIVVIINGGLVATFLKIDENLNIVAIDIALLNEQKVILNDIKNILLEKNKPKEKIIDINV
jgi:hypothetical protein